MKNKLSTLLKFKNNEVVRTIFVQRMVFLHVGVFTVYSSASVLSGSIFFEQINDRVIPHRSIESLIILFSTVCTILFIISLLDKIRSNVFERLSNNLYYDLSRRIIMKYINNESKNFDAALLMRDTIDNMLLRDFINSHAFTALFDLLSTPVYLFVMYSIHPYLGYASILVVVSFFYLGYVQAVNRFKQSEFSKFALYENRTRLAEILRNSETIQVLGMSKVFESVWIRKYTSTITISKNRDRKTAPFEILSRFLMSSFSGVLLSIGLLLVIRGDMSQGNAIGCMMIAGKLLQPISIIGSEWTEFFQVISIIERLDLTLREKQVASHTDVEMSVRSFELNPKEINQVNVDLI